MMQKDIPDILNTLLDSFFDIKLEQRASDSLRNYSEERNVTPECRPWLPIRCHPIWVTRSMNLGPDSVSFYFCTRRLILGPDLVSLYL